MLWRRSLRLRHGQIRRRAGLRVQDFAHAHGNAVRFRVLNHRRLGLRRLQPRTDGRGRQYGYGPRLGGQVPDRGCLDVVNGNRVVAGLLLDRGVRRRRRPFRVRRRAQDRDRPGFGGQRPHGRRLNIARLQLRLLLLLLDRGRMLLCRLLLLRRGRRPGLLPVNRRLADRRRAARRSALGRRAQDGYGPRVGGQRPHGRRLHVVYGPAVAVLVLRVLLEVVAFAHDVVVVVVVVFSVVTPDGRPFRLVLVLRRFRRFLRLFRHHHRLERGRHELLFRRRRRPRLGR